ncbi:MAG TPA: hypothetical protein VFV58_30890 [Blastocatellia bacterium]|jgi:hypothetical protein|nr:hypothetical protein [Blastocatellia bacterium]
MPSNESNLEVTPADDLETFEDFEDEMDADESAESDEEFRQDRFTWNDGDVRWL